MEDGVLYSALEMGGAGLLIINPLASATHQHLSTKSFNSYQHGNYRGDILLTVINSKLPIWVMKTTSSSTGARGAQEIVPGIDDAINTLILDVVSEESDDRVQIKLDKHEIELLTERSEYLEELIKMSCESSFENNQEVSVVRLTLIENSPQDAAELVMIIVDTNIETRQIKFNAEKAKLSVKWCVDILTRRYASVMEETLNQCISKLKEKPSNIMDQETKQICDDFVSIVLLNSMYDCYDISFLSNNSQLMNFLISHKGLRRKEILEPLSRAAIGSDNLIEILRREFN